jgi:predicted 3-demethylubiquinone-9 3-methyltransferase (glyoxalase superfamily)
MLPFRRDNGRPGRPGRASFIAEVPHDAEEQALPVVRRERPRGRRVLRLGLQGPRRLWHHGRHPWPGRAPLVVAFRLAGVEFLALNGGPHFKFNEAISLSVDCGSQEELDELWEQLSAGGSPGPCGWLKDRYGLSWQIVPAALPKLLAGADRGRAQRVMAAVIGITKLDIRSLEAAADAK